MHGGAANDPPEGGCSRRWLASLFAAAAIVLVVVAPPAEAASVSAGSLRAEISEDPWGLSFRGAGGRSVLSEHPGTGLGPSGTLGFRTPAGWFHATEVVSARREGARYVAELATTDPAGRRIEVELSPDGEGAIALEARVRGSTAELTALGIGFRAREGEGERYLGFGERSNAVDQRGNAVENYVSDGPYQDEERAFLEAFIPPWGFRERDDATYFPMPWLLSTGGYGVLVDNSETSYFRLGSDRQGAWSLEVTDAPPGEVGDEGSSPPRRLALRVFAGPQPADALRRLTERIGRQPEPFAPWFLGAWFHTGQENQPPRAQERRYVRLLREGDAPVSVVETHLRYLPCGAAVGRRERERERTRFLHSRGLATISYVNPEICTDYEPVYSRAVAQDVLTEDRDGDPYVYIAYVGDRTPPQTPISQIDFSAPGAQSFFDGLLRQPVRDGHDGWMEDFGEYTPLDSQSANGMDGTEMHNLYPVLYHRAGFRFARRQSRPIARHVRSGWTGVHPYAQIVWGGDPTTDWGFDGLASAVKQGLTMGLSGIGVWGSDIGGFFSLGARRLTPELLKRWVQFGAVSGVMRTKKAGVAVPPQERPQVWEPGQLPNWRRYSKLRTQLYPYIVAANAEYRRAGVPLMRHLALAYPGDSRATAREDQFLFGPDLLAAPVIEPGARTRRLYLPRGRWVDLWRSVTYERKSGGLRLGAARTVRGRRSLTLPAPLAELPLLARAGTLLPLLPRDVDTLAGYGRRKLVKLSERRDAMELLAFPRGRSSARFHEGERLRSRERPGRWILAVDGERRRSYDLQASMRTLGQELEPCRLTLEGRHLPEDAWRYDGRREALSATFRTRSGILVASERCGGPGGRGQGGGRSEDRGGDAADGSDDAADGPHSGPGAGVRNAGRNEPASGAGAAISAEAPTEAAGKLPFTGLGLGALAAGALVLLAAGSLLRSRARSSDGS